MEKLKRLNSSSTSTGRRSSNLKDKIVEQIFFLFIEFLSTFDLITDGFILYELARSDHIGWLCAMIQTIAWPFFVSYVPFISYNQTKMRDQQFSNSSTDKIKSFLFAFLASTPLLITYLVVVDTIFLLISGVISPLLMLISVLSCSRVSMNGI